MSNGKNANKSNDKFELKNSLDRFTRSLYSLSYDGYFVKSFFNEYWKPLGLLAAYRIFFNEDGTVEKFHEYEKLPDMAKKIEALEDIKELRRQIKKYCRAKNHEIMVSDCNENFRYPDPYCKSYVVITVCSCNGSTSIGKCNRDNKSHDRQITGAIILFSNKEKNLLNAFLEHDNFAELQRLFNKYEEPSCYGNYNKTGQPVCNSCWWSDNCKSLREKNANEVLDLDEILSQLKTKFQYVRKKRDELPILVYNPASRLLTYRAINYLNFPDFIDEEWMKYQKKALAFKDIDIANELRLSEKILKLRNSDCSENTEKKIGELTQEYKKIFDKVVQQLNDSATLQIFRKQALGEARELFKATAQRVTTGLTSDIWRSFESYALDIAKLGDDGSGNLYGEQLRRFCEGLFFTFKGYLITTPLGYIGQKLGIVFTMVTEDELLEGNTDTRDKEDIIEDKIEELSDHFNGIAKEFAPLLFHSLQAKTYQDALASLKDRDPLKVIEIICESLPRAFNVTAVVYRMGAQEEKNIYYGFRSCEDEVMFGPLSTAQDKDAIADLSAEENFANFTGAFKIGPYTHNGTIYSCSNEKKIRTRSRILLNLDPDHTRLPVQKGILDIHFDLSEYSLRRNATDIVREIEFLIHLIFEAAAQKYMVMQQSLKSAVSAIMGRNMSHNIGSHVLARYSSAAGRIGEQRYVDWSACTDLQKFVAESATRGSDDHRAVLLRYLQRRMDFIAEVATSDKSFWVQSLNLRGVLSALNYKEETKRINPEDKDKDITTSKGHTYKPILLTYITGKEGIDATVEFDPSVVGDPYFTCPGGEVGAHALYVILENVIRNSARHNTGVDKVELIVKIEDAAGKDEESLWQVTIIDCKSSVDRLEEINDIITKEKMLNNDGSPNPKYWGIREMQICAQYLRQFSMTDIQNNAVKPTVLKAVPWQYEGKECLAYQIYLHRAKFCALVPGPDCFKDDEAVLNNLNKILKPKGIAILPLPLAKASFLNGYNFVIGEGEISIKSEQNKEERVLKITSNVGEEANIDLLSLPVRTISVDHEIMNERIESLKSAVLSSQAFEPESWVEPLHEMLWKSYRDKKETNWKGKEIRCLVAWNGDKTYERIIETGPCPDRLFCHTRVATGKPSKGDEALDIPYNRFGIKLFNKLGCAWVDHANPDLFNKFGNPDLRSSGFETNRPPNLVQPFIFAEITDSLSPHLSVLARQANDKKDEIAGNELVAAALARVIVLDERVQNEISRSYRGVEYRDLWPCMGIWVPEAKNGSDERTAMLPVADLNIPNFDQIQQYLINPARRADQYPPDFLVLHLTILEHLRKKKNHSCEAQTLAELLKGTKIGGDCHIVIVTGRGVSTLVRHDSDGVTLPVRYLPISALLEYLLARPSKLALMRALWSAATTTKALSHASE